MLAGCYNGTAAAQYADQHTGAQGYGGWNSAYVSFAADCTNFVSQAINAGGAAWQGFPGNPDVQGAWWGIQTTDTTAKVAEDAAILANNSTTSVATPPSTFWHQPVAGYDSVAWVREQGFLSFALHAKNALGKPWATVVGSYSYKNEYRYGIKAPSTPAGMYPGDVYAYDLYGNGGGLAGTDHLTFQVAGSPGQAAVAADRTGHGDLVDQHTVNRYHTLWTLKAYNTSWPVSSIYFISINGGD